MHPKVRQAIEEIDAAVFNGDTFDEPEARAELLDTLERWTRELTVVTVADNLRDVQHVRTTDGPKHIARGAVASMGPIDGFAYNDGISEHVPYATPIDGSVPACIDEQGRTARDILRERRATFEQLYPEVGERMAIIRAGQGTSPQQKQHAARWLLQHGVDECAPELANEIRAAFQPPRYDAAKVEASFTPKGGQPVRFVGMTVETCWKCGRDVKFGVRHGEHQCDRAFLEERLHSFVGHVVNQMMVSGEKVTIDPVTLGRVAGRVSAMYVDDSDREYPKVEIDCDAMLRAMGRIRVTVWFSKRAPDDHTYDVAVVYPPLRGAE